MHHAEDLGAALQYIRGPLRQELAPYHLHALFRVFSHHQDCDSVLQLLDVMSGRGETTLETYARAVDFLHCSAPADVLPRALRACALALDAFGSHIFRPTAGSELATVAAYGAGPERLEALADPHAMPGAPGEDALDPACRAAPVLSALLHHTSCCAGTPLAPLLVAVWIRALGVELSDWDYACLLCALLTQTEGFPQVVQTVGLFAAFPAGEVSPAAFLERLRARGLCGAGAAHPLAQLAAAMEDGLRREGVDPLAAVTVGVVNTQCTTLEALVEGVLRDAEARPGLGPSASTPRSCTRRWASSTARGATARQAARQLLRALEGRRRWALTYAADRPPAAAVGEPYHISVQHVLDVGGLMPVLSGRCLAALRAPYQQLVKETEVAASEERLRVSAGAVHSGGAAAAALTTVTTLQAPPRVPSSVDAIACATYATNLLQSNEEARAALQRAIGLIDTGARRRLPRTTRQLLRQFAEFCSRHPLPNCKLTPVGLQERLKWSSYLEARDTALALFGSAQQARDAMKEMYLNHNQLRELRSAAVIAQDSADVAAIFFPALPPAGTRRACGRSGRRCRTCGAPPTRCRGTCGTRRCRTPTPT
ncbi:hypothetical protein STCU_09858 [Strigomonas culicis]|uniref:Uncharacterized protein n=1 Tax=Strigomonas culicis TaxID=28005 RepID=S9TPP8_9TRYP|nr:hypothetical protein STCU_09858 [Strigomonas culicis]|eukprot:EPY18614.1 hypothetical protein STCU_09858 [Strigomonas culicis]